MTNLQRVLHAARDMFDVCCRCLPPCAQEMLLNLQQHQLTAVTLAKNAPLNSGQPTRTWPLGPTLFYLDRFEEAAGRLDTDIRLFERQFEDSATDERIWRAAALIADAKERDGADAVVPVAKLPPLEIKETTPLRRAVYEVSRRQTC